MNNSYKPLPEELPTQEAHPFLEGNYSAEAWTFLGRQFSWFLAQRHQYKKTEVEAPEPHEGTEEAT